MSWISSVATRISSFLHALQPTARAPNLNGSAARARTQEPNSSKKKDAPRLLGHIRDGTGERTSRRETQSMPPVRRRPRSRSSSPVELQRLQAGDAQCERLPEQRIKDSQLFGEFCRDNFRRHMAQLKFTVEDAGEDPCQFSLVIGDVPRFRDLLPNRFTSLGGGAALKPIGPGLIVVKVVLDPALERDAVQQLVQLVKSSASAKGAMLLLASEVGNSVERAHMQCSLVGRFNDLKALNSGLDALVATTEFDADAWSKRVATLRGRSSDRAPPEDAEARWRSKSRGSCERRELAPPPRSRLQLASPEPSEDRLFETRTGMRGSDNGARNRCRAPDLEDRGGARIRGRAVSPTAGSYDDFRLTRL